MTKMSSDANSHSSILIWAWLKWHLVRLPLFLQLCCGASSNLFNSLCDDCMPHLTPLGIAGAQLLCSFMGAPTWRLSTCNTLSAPSFQASVIRVTAVWLPYASTDRSDATLDWATASSGSVMQEGKEVPGFASARRPLKSSRSQKTLAEEGRSLQLGSVRHFARSTFVGCCNIPRQSSSSHILPMNKIVQAFAGAVRWHAYLREAPVHRRPLSLT